MNQDNFITKLFNIEFIPNIDYEKTTPTINETKKILNLHLERTIFYCPYCQSRLIIRDSKKERINHVLKGGEPCLIIFHKRRYYCPSCSSIISEKLEGIDRSRGISEGLKHEILYSLRDSTLTYHKVSERLNVSQLKMLLYKPPLLFFRATRLYLTA